MASRPAGGNGPHSAGIFADMTVDGPEIGTLVLIVDRAKNLPNRKAMGKQNPYCAARLGKEARKTETDQRGGQTPKWDQELRFTVHDSPDYYTLKLSAFSEDNKRTDLIGEAWVSLSNVIVPGGGKNDLWQSLNCKGKYAGEIRIELTYYDSREKPDKMANKMTVAEELHEQYNTTSTSSRVKRRPLPANPNVPSTTEVKIPDRPAPGRARHGPRDYSTPLRANSMPQEMPTYPHSASSLVGQVPVHALSHTHSPISPSYEQAPPTNQHYHGYEPNPEPQVYADPYATPDFLPQLPPSSRQHRSSFHTPQAQVHPSYASGPTQQPPPQPRPLPHVGLAHSYSAPVIPSAHPDHGDRYDHYDSPSDYHEHVSDLQHQYHEAGPGMHDPVDEWQNEHEQPYSEQHYLPQDDIATPPPPPMHSHSAPAVPQYGSPHSLPPPSASRYGNTPPASRQAYVPNSSPLQSIERNYSPQDVVPRGPPSRGRSTDDYYSGSPTHRGYDSGPMVTPPNSSPHGRTPPSRQHPGRHSIAEPFGSAPRPHPLSREVPRARSPNPYSPEGRGGPSPSGQDPYHFDYRGHDAVPLIKPRALSPQPHTQPQPPPPQPRQRSSYNIQHPVRAFESSDASPLSTPHSPAGRMPQRSPQITPTRKSVSPRPSMSEGTRSSVPFSPDSFDIHNPNAPGSAERTARPGPIINWQGKEVDPSDHLPVESWAPEPERKVPEKTYGLGRERDFGPRVPLGATTTDGRISKDTVINVRMKGQSPAHEPAAPGRNRLVKKSAPPANRSSAPVEPLRERDYNSVPNPYEQPQQYSSGFIDGSPGFGDGGRSVGGGGGSAGRYENYGPPSVPPKLPLSSSSSSSLPPPPGHGGGYGPDALTREISSIDLGPGGGRHHRASTGFQPVRSHRDRNSYY